MLELLQAAVAKRYAVPSFCVWNAESMIAVVDVAVRLRAPVILMGGPAEFYLLEPAIIGEIARAVICRRSHRVALHLDHGDSLAVVKDCLAAGYTSVMLDYSQRPFAENVAALREAAGLAHPKGVTVEGELGHVGRADNVTAEGTAASTLTEVAEAASYVAQTGIDALAVSIGNAHGQYTQLPQLDFQRLGEIHETVKIPLVLHGGSGTPPEDLRRAISLGIAKVNVATDLVTAVRESLRTQWNVGSNRWLPIAKAAAIGAMIPVVERWIRACGADGKA